MSFPNPFAGRVLTHVLLVMLALLLPVSPLLAWNAPGHMIIAAEAWRELPAKYQKRAAEVLRHHPEYAKWEKALAADAPDIDPAASIFMRASTWPDEIRETQSEYNHPRWHFINYPLEPKSFPMEPAPALGDDVLYGIGQCEKTLSSTRTSPELRAVYLSYLIHLVGDLHQPLHCVSLVDKTYPKGDKGGNDFFVKPGERGISLHSLWDGLLGRSVHVRSQWNEAIQIEAAHPRKSLPELRRARTPRDWSLESRSVAIEQTYFRGKLRGSTDWETAPSLPSDYTRNAKTAAERQAALAGYRLADTIEKYLR